MLTTQVSVRCAVNLPCNKYLYGLTSKSGYLDFKSLIQILCQIDVVIKYLTTPKEKTLVLL